MSIEILQDIADNALHSTWHLENNLFILAAVSAINITESLVGASPRGVAFVFYELAAYWEREKMKQHSLVLDKTP